MCQASYMHSLRRGALDRVKSATACMHHKINIHSFNLLVSATKPPKLIPSQILQLYGIINLYKYAEHRVETDIDKRLTNRQTDKETDRLTDRQTDAQMIKCADMLLTQG